MRLSIVLGSLIWLRLSSALPGAERSLPPLPPSTCRNPVSSFDYSAKNRREAQLPLCPTDEYHSLKRRDDESPVLAETSLSSLFGRQVVGGDDYTCGPDRPCKNKSCCPKATLSCNYGEEYCGTNGVSPNDVCWSNCDAKAECGKNAAIPGQGCPLNVCCGKWGFCGMTADFCDRQDHGATGGCQSNCDQPGPTGKASDPSRVIGYYEAWRADVECQGMPLDAIPIKSLTHLYFSFASITPGDFSLVGMEGIPETLFAQFTDLKRKNPALKIIIAIGGWAFNDPGPTREVFSNMVSNSQNRQKFIGNLMSFLRKYAFDGVDFDWEYPGADDRGGVPADGANFVEFLKELDDVNSKQPVKYVVSFTAPTSYWYLRHFDLKAVDHVDYINVMSYDLHGVWDANNPIGSYIYGHTNLTEMRLAFDLFWRNNVPANKLNMGLGFYGRAFQLADPACSKPGCMFKAGATKGGCSGESGILSYREIQDILHTKKIKPIWDQDAGVKYITFNSDQWVSFDDADTFSQKKELAKELGLGGYLIWAIDQDDPLLSALQAVISPRQLGNVGVVNNPNDWQGSDARCYISTCGSGCNTGDIKITQQPCGDGKKNSNLCCPLSYAPDPKDCTWRGNPTLCNGHCHDDEVMMEMNKWGGGGGACHDGNKAYCCKSPLAQENTCYWAGVGKKCNGDDLPLTFSGTVLSVLEDVAKVILAVIGRAVPLVSLVGQELLDVLDKVDMDTKKLYCCPKDDISRWKNCAWYGKPGSCFDGHCPDMTFAQLTDSYFGGGDTCGAQLSRTRTFCCEPAKDPLFLPVPLENLFRSPPKGDSVDIDFTLKTDKTSDTTQDPNDAAFQFVVLASPQELQVSLDKRDGSHWELFGCNDAVTEGEHTVRMVCTDYSEDSNCHMISLGHGVPGTILQMPEGCGPGKYAVAKDMVPSSKLLPRSLSHLAPHGPVVYDLTFDYEFQRVPRDLGSTQMRIDFSNEDNYWNTVVAGAASKHKKSKRSLDDFNGNHVRWLEEEFREDYHFGGLEKRHLEERWFGLTVIKWLAQMLKPEIKREFVYKYQDTLTAKIVDEEWECEKGDVTYQGHVLAQALLNIEVDTSFGFTLIVEDLKPPLDLKQSYLTFYNKGKITGVLTLEAVAKVFYQKSQVILNIPFPGASFRIPGIATLGPQITVEGSLDASLSVAGIIETKVDIANWDVRQVVPDGNSPQYKPTTLSGNPDLDQTGDLNGIKRPEFYAGVEVEGDMSASLGVAAEFGIRFDSRWDVNPAAVAIVGEASVSAKLGAGISTTGSCPFTYGVDVGARLYARVQAPDLFGWPGASYDITPNWKKSIITGGTCPDLGNIPSKRDLIGLDAGSNYSTSLIDADSEALQRRGLLRKRGGVYGPAFSIPIGNFFCPPSDDANDKDGSACSLPGAWDHDKYLTNDDDYDYVPGSFSSGGGLFKRRAPVPEDSYGFEWLNNITTVSEEHLLEKRAYKNVKLCSLRTTFQYPSAGRLPSALAYGFDKPDVCGDYNFGAPLGTKAAGTQYDTEHVLEAQLPAQFFDEINAKGQAYQHPDPSNPSRISFCDLVNLHFDGYNVAIPGLDTARGNGATLTPIVHVASQFPTGSWHADEYVVLEHEINIPAKGKAWGTESTIVDTSEWKTKYLQTETGAREMLISMRKLIGQRIYQTDPYIKSIMDKQVQRMKTVFDRLDKDILPNNPPRPGWRGWTPLGLADGWQTFMRSKFYTMQAKTSRIIDEFLPALNQQYASDAKRQASEDADGDSDADKARKQATRNLISDIDAMNQAWQSLPAWPNPF